MNSTLQIRNFSPCLKTFTLTALALWFSLALGLSLAGLFDSRMPILIGLAVIIPIGLFITGYLRFGEFRRFVLSADVRLLTLPHVWRVAGITFLILERKGILPAVFALPAGFGDIAIGATAPLIASMFLSGKSLSNRAFIWWNVLGLLDLVTAVALGILASNGPLGILASGATTRVMGQFPLSLIPTFLVPLFIILHLIALFKARSTVALRS
ncbi:MAG TPA: hypothetical protein VK327_00460 [Candidatus Paceibacterota bacterium]|nr:hypothetical protein [Candidatus Paceibacterota bacterium]